MSWIRLVVLLVLAGCGDDDPGPDATIDARSDGSDRDAPDTTSDARDDAMPDAPPDDAPSDAIAPEDASEDATASMSPQCRNVGTSSEGWYHPTTDDEICLTSCGDATAPSCGAIGSRSEGWYTDEGAGCMGALIAWDDCG